MKRILFTAATLLWMGMIFSMSAADGEQSGGMSAKVCQWIGKTMHADFDQWTEVRQQEFVEKLQYPIRKTAHFTEYMILGILLYLTLRTWGAGGRKAFLLVLLIGVLYAGSDELHQCFVADRSGNFLDVLLDSTGVLTGSGICAWRGLRKHQQA